MRPLAVAALLVVAAAAASSPWWFLRPSPRPDAATRAATNLPPQDDVNAAAFAEVYKDLLAMYVRLGGERPSPR